MGICEIKNPKIKYGVIIIGYIVIATITISIVSLLFYYLYSTGYLLKFLQLIADLGYWGNLILGVCIMITNLPLVIGYGTLLIAAGFLYGFGGGLVTVMTSCQIVIFLLALLLRFPFIFLRAQLYIESKKYLKGVRDEIERHRFKFCILVRLTPLPLGLQNLAIPLTSITLWEYQLSSLLGMAPKQIAFVYMGSTLYELAEVISGNAKLTWRQWILGGVGIVGMITLVFFLYYITKKVYRQVQLNQTSDVIDDGDGEKIYLVDMDNKGNFDEKSPLLP